MMDVEKLIKQLRSAAKLEAYYNSEYNGLYNQTADALEKLQAELQKSEHDNVNLTGELAKVAAELEQVKQERDAAIKEILQWTGCPACKHWDSADNWCNKHDRSADSCDGCSTPEWRGLHKEE